MKLITAVIKPFKLEENGKTLAIYPADEFSVEYEIGFQHPLIGHQHLSMDLTPDNYAAWIAPARTFGFLHEVEALQAAGLVRGGSLENAIVLTESGMLNDTSLRFQDEFVRHKMLDVIGDLALVGHAIAGHVSVTKGGHALHAELAAELLRQRDSWSLVDAPVAAGQRVPVVGTATA